MHFNFPSAPVTARCPTLLDYQASHQPASLSFLYQKDVRMKVARGTGNMPGLNPCVWQNNKNIYLPSVFW